MEVVGKLTNNSMLRYCLLLSFLFVGCSTEHKKRPSKKEEKKQIIVPTFNSDSAYHFVQKQVDFGPRALGSKGSKECAVFLKKTLIKYTPNVFVQEAPVTTYDNKKHILKNIIASFSPDKKNRIVLMAHWDTRPIADYDTERKTEPILGANDGGSGVAVLLELARQFSVNEPAIGIDIVLFDAEDYGQPENSSFPIMEDSWCLGSQYWANNPHVKNYYPRYGILLDMVGAENATFTHEAVSRYYANNVLQKVWRQAHKLGFGNYFLFQDSKQILDDHYYVNIIANIPTIDIIEFDPSTETNFNKHWHTHKDDMNNIDKKTLMAVGQTLMHVIYNE